MKYQFRPYAELQPIEVTLTGKIYEVGEHPIYKEYKIIEAVDDEGGIIDAFEDELTSDEAKEQEIGYSEEEVKVLLRKFFVAILDESKITMEEWFEQFKKK